MNNRGQAVGSMDVEGGHIHAFLWHAGSLRDLETLGGKDSAAFAINDHGEVVGAAKTRAGFTHAFLWKAGRMIDLGTVRGYRWSSARAINGHGQIVGTAFREGEDTLDEYQQGLAIAWHGKRAYALNHGRPFKGRILVNARAIDKWGDIIGEAPDGSDFGGRCPFIYRMGRIGYLSTPHGMLLYTASGANNRGWVVGGCSGGADVVTAVRWRRGRMYILAPPHVWRSSADGVNDKCQVVGYVDMARRPGQEDPHATLWEHGRVLNLNYMVGRRPDWDPIEARGINDRGQIVGSGIRYGHHRAFLLTPK